MACMCFDSYETPKSSINRDLSTPFLIQLVMLLVSNRNRVADKMLPCGKFLVIKSREECPYSDSKFPFI